MPFDIVDMEVITDSSESKVEELLGCERNGRGNLENTFKMWERKERKSRGRKESSCKGEMRCGGKARGRRGRFDTERKESEGEIV